LYYTYSKTFPTGAIDSTVVSLSRAYLSSLVGIPLLVKVMVLIWTLVVISRVVTLIIQTLKSVRAGYTSYSSLFRRVRLGIGLAIPSQQSVVLNSVRTTTFLTFSALSTTSICRMSSMLAIVTLGHSKIYNSIVPKVK